MPPRPSRFRRILRAIFGPMWSPVPAAFAAVGVMPSIGLHECVDCGADMVWPTTWSALDDEHWTIALRCGQCGCTRETVATNAEAVDFDGVLDDHRRAIQRALDRDETLRMADEVDCFVEALRRDLIDAGDFRRAARGGSA
jgi:hypothetical protein